jgi:hypothetical protein
MPARFRPSDPRARGRDSYEGMKVIAVILSVWSFGFLWLSVAGYVPWISGNYTNTACCNLLDFCILALSLGVLLRFRKEERMKRWISERLKSDGAVAVRDVSGEFVMNPASAAKVMHDWMRENPGTCELDPETGIMKMRPVE